MTGPSHTLVINETELILIKEALALMIRRCAEEIGKGSEEPFHLCLREAEKVLERLSSNRA